MKKLFLIAIIAFTACSTDKENFNGTLQSALVDIEVVPDNVIACAALNQYDNLISVFLYPRDGATDLQYYETIDAQSDKNNFEEYYQLDVPLLDVFNGYLKKFEISASQEKWVIVSFKEDGKIHISNPIRLKQNSKPTEYLPKNVSVDTIDATMPKFTWKNGTFQDTKIYFQVLSDNNNDLISGTYTFDQEFQFYHLDNVVLNITKGTPSALKQSESHKFTLLAVSEDNWVNLFSEVEF